MINMNYVEYQNILETACNTILNGRIILYPTDTVFGLGCNGLNEKAVEKIEKIKKVEEKKPISAMFGHIDIIKQYCKVSEEQEEILNTYLPGPYTFILPLKKQLPLSTNKTLGVRIPNHKFCIDLGKTLKIPIASTSANINKEPTQYQLNEINKKIIDQVDYIVKGECKEKEASTIVNLINGISIIRQGTGIFEI